MPHEATLRDAKEYLRRLRDDQAENFSIRGKDWARRAHEEIVKVEAFLQKNADGPIEIRSEWI